MSQLAEIIAAFGQTLGIQRLSLNDERSVQFKLDSGLTYALEETEEEVLLVQLLFPISAFDAYAIKKRLLALADYRKPKKNPIYVLPYSRESMIVQIRLPVATLTVQDIEQSMEYLLHCSEYATGQRAMV